MDNTLQQFKNLVGTKFQLYNSLFTSLPFHRIEKTGVLLSLFLLHCEEGYMKQKSPIDIITSFLQQYTSYTNEQQKIDLLFRFIQYAERQVVLFDALEDAAFREVTDTEGAGTLKHLESEVVQKQKQHALAERLKNFSVRLVLTAHPTQFYPGNVLGIINDLSKALSNNNTEQINQYLQQLGKTPFLKKEKPTPYDEAISLIWYLENVFYKAFGKIISHMKTSFPDAISEDHPIVRLGFWPGGDRDGNPFVNAETTLQVANALNGAIIKCYYMDVRRLKRRLTFKGVENILADLESKLYQNLFIPGGKAHITREEILQPLLEIREALITMHNGLFLYKVNDLINKVQVFGMYFASLDIRQDSSVHTSLYNTLSEKGLLPGNYPQLTDEEKIQELLKLPAINPDQVPQHDLMKDTLATIGTIKNIQHQNGKDGCHRYIISHSMTALNVLEVYALFKLCGWKKEEINIDIVPLFETIEDLQNAASIMRALYLIPEYREHLKRRNNTQTIMMGFSDGTKDGGYLTANWSIYKAKEELTKISQDHEINVVFFDGRGGPPARGGGKTNKFYASLGNNIANNEIQLTIQGQTVSANFGTVDAAQYNVEELIHAGIVNDIFSSRKTTLTKEEDNLLQTLSDESLSAYSELKDHPYFLDYLSHVSPLRFYAETNIGSRPAKRNAGSKLTLNDLRAIPFVGAWSQLKQNVTGFYGVGTALKKMEENGKWKEIEQLYRNSLFFKTLLDNCEMVLKKSFFPLTAYLSKDKKYGEIWNKIYEECELTKRYLLRLSGETELMSNYPVSQLSIQMRERIVLPLLTIQQYGITKVRELEESHVNSSFKESYESLVMRCSFGIINAARNSA